MEVNQSASDYFRFCPGEERVKISNAICRGRRRIHFPKCHGCQFNDDEGATVIPPSTQATRSAEAASVDSVFRPHDVCSPSPLLLHSDLAWRIGYASAQFLHGRLRGFDRADSNVKTLIVGRDARPSGLDIQSVLIDGIRAAGVDVIDVGVIDTPQLYFAVNHLGTCGGIQVTGGTTSSGCNGFTICGSKAVPITSETGLISIRDIASRVPKHQTGTTARLVGQDVTEPYRGFIGGLLRGRDRLAKPLKVVADACHGVAGRWLPVVFEGVGNLNIIRLNDDVSGMFPHDPNPLDPANLRDVRRIIKQEKADFGICFDGDASSCVFVDERGVSLRSDRLAAVFARMLIGRTPGATVVLDLRSTRAAFEEVERVGGVPIAARADIVSMKRTMSERGAIFGADLDGRFYFRDGFFGESAFLAMVHMLNLLADSDRRLGELIRPLYRYRSPGEVRFACRDPEKLLQRLVATSGDAEVVMFDGITLKHGDWWLVARQASPFNPVLMTPGSVGPGPGVLITLEARNKDALAEKLSHIRVLVAEQD